MRCTLDLHVAVDSLVNLYDGECGASNGDVYHDIRMLDQFNDKQPLLGAHGKLQYFTL